MKRIEAISWFLLSAAIFAGFVGCGSSPQVGGGGSQGSSISAVSVACTPTGIQGQSNEPVHGKGLRYGQLQFCGYMVGVRRHRHPGRRLHALGCGHCNRYCDLYAETPANLARPQSQ